MGLELSIMSISELKNLKIALAQIEVIPGQPEKNIATMLRYIQQAKDQKVDIIVFPELCVGGYMLGDLYLQTDYCLNLMAYNEDIRQASKGIAIIFGNIYVD
jgi:NAD+ synthase (glutamine-hydrolysing)